MKLVSMNDWLNPILLKEIRQMFHNTLTAIMITLLLFAELVLVFFVSKFYDGSDEGEWFFGVQCVGFAFVCFVLCAFRTCWLFNRERHDKELDYSRLSMISPSTVAIGKLLSSCLMMIFVLSLVMPFMLIAYFLRGISIATILFTNFYVIIMTLLLIQLSLLLGSFGKKGMELLAFVIGGAYCISVLVVVIALIEISNFDTLLGFACVIPFLLIILVQLYAWTVASIRRGSGNVMFAPRLCTFIIAFLITAFNALMVFCKVSNDVEEILAVIISVMLTFFYIILHVASVFERETPGSRIMRERGKSHLKRFLGVFFTSSRYNSMALSILLYALFFINMMLCSDSDMKYVYVVFLSISLCMFAYCQFAMLLHRWFPNINVGILLIASIVGLVVLPLIFVSLFALVTGLSLDIAVYAVTTPFICIGQKDNPYIIFVSMVMAGVFVLPFTKNIIKSITSYVFEEI